LANKYLGIGGSKKTIDDLRNEDLEGGIRPPVGRQGGKYFSREKVIDNFIEGYEGMTYVEPFVGGGSIFYNKERSKKEVINDLDDSVYKLFKVIRDTSPNVLNARVNGQYNRQEFRQLLTAHPSTDMGETVRFILLTKLSYLGAHHTFNDIRGPVKTVEMDMTPYHERLKGVTILHEDYKKVIAKYDSPTTFFFLDPPYEHSGKLTSQYTDIDLEELSKILKGLKGKFLLTINSSPRVRQLFGSFFMSSFRVPYLLKRRMVTELMFSNYKR